MADEDKHGAAPDDEKPKGAHEKSDGEDEGKEQADAAKENDGDSDDEEQPQRLRDRPGLLIGGTLAILLIVTAGVLYWLHARQFESTDDAYVDGHIIRLAPQVSGIVRQILVDDNQVVGPRQLLAVIDTAQPRARYEGQVADAARARANVAQSIAQVAVARQQVATAQANIRQPQADLDKAEADLARYLAAKRVEPGAVAGQQIDQAVQAVASARARRDAARRQVDEARAQLKANRTQIASSRAQVGAADAQVRATAVDLSNANITAPIVGRIANRTIGLGSYVSPGQQIMAIVPLKLWITANFKETQLKLMRVGQPVDIKIDAIPDVEFHGHVASFQRGAGQAFALLPAENATGNFVKVVQRVPVRIEVDSPALQAYPVGPGMSVVPRVKVR